MASAFVSLKSIRMRRMRSRSNSSADRSDALRLGALKDF
jgi:hypothetical protein